MHGDTGKLVDRQQMLVFPHNFMRKIARELLELGLGCHADRRNAQFVTRRELGFCLCSATIHADLAGANDAVNVCFRDAF